MSTRRHIVVLDDYEQAFTTQADWSSITPDAEVSIHSEPLKGPALIHALTGADAVVLMRDRTPFKRELIEQLPNLKFVMFTGTRNTALDLQALSERGIPVCHTNWGPSKDSTAELTWALIMAAHKRVVEQNRLLTSQQWRNKHSLLPVLKGQTMGVIGLGEIGGRVAGFAKAFGMQVLTWSPNMTPERAQAAGVQAVSLDTLLQSAHVVSLHLVPAASSKGLINAERLQLMRPDSILVNTSRSALIHTADLIAALHEGTIGQAALDVFDQEPLPADDPLRACPRLLMTPHLGFIAQPVFEAFLVGVIEGLTAWLRDAPLVRRLPA